MGRCEHPECEVSAHRRIFVGEEVYEYCLEHYDVATAVQQNRRPQWEPDNS